MVRLEMSDETDREIRRLSREITIVGDKLDRLLWAFKQLLVALRRGQEASPNPPALAGTFTLGEDMSSTQLTVTIPTTRTDGSALDATDLVSVTFQKVAAGAAAGSAPTTLQVNSEAKGTGLSPTDLEFTDISAAVGDVYTAFVTDSEGNLSANSNSFTNTAIAPVLAAPAAPGLAGVFTA